MKKMICGLFFYGSALALLAHCRVPVPHAPVKLVSAVQDKNFYVLSLMERSPAVTKALMEDHELEKLADAERDGIARCEAAKASNPDCTIDIALFNDAQIDLVSKQLAHLYETNPAVRALVAGPMHRSGFFELYAAGTDKALFVHAWIDAAHGIDQILNTYGKGAPPHLPKIDSASFEMNSPAGRQLLLNFYGTLAKQPDGIFFEPSLRLALLLLDANHRDEAGRFEPLESGENAAAIRRLVNIRWSDYRYTVILVPGRGPDQVGVNLAPEGQQRIALAAKNYKAGLAPILLVSGGFVHPAQTPFCEAIEMKKALIADFGIPADAILVDPYARHTTTNLRNATRLIYRYGIPFDSPALVTTDVEQSAYIESSIFSARSKNELGYVPYRRLTRISAVDLAFLPELDSLQADSSDPLDP